MTDQETDYGLTVGFDPLLRSLRRHFLKPRYDIPDKKTARAMSLPPASSSTPAPPPEIGEAK
jgi:hypothetical protein